jgi:hypothetical protein
MLPDSDLLLSCEMHLLALAVTGGTSCQVEIAALPTLRSGSKSWAIKQLHGRIKWLCFLRIKMKKKLFEDPDEQIHKVDNFPL